MRLKHAIMFQITKQKHFLTLRVNELGSSRGLSIRTECNPVVGIPYPIRRLLHTLGTGMGRKRGDEETQQGRDLKYKIQNCRDKNSSKNRFGCFIFFTGHDAERYLSLVSLSNKLLWCEKKRTSFLRANASCYLVVSSQTISAQAVEAAATSEQPGLICGLHSKK